MANFNKVMLMGNLTRDPEMRYTPQGTAVANLGLAVNRVWKDKAGGEKKDVCFVTVVTWDKQAEVCNQYLRKGSPVFVEGRLQSRSWEDKTGQKRSVLEVRAERVQFLSGGAGKATQGTTGAFTQDQAPAPLPEEHAPISQEDSEEDFLEA